MVAPNYFTSNAGTKINVTGITGKPLKRIQTLANDNYGTKAAQIAKRQRLMIPKVAGTPAVTTPVTPVATTPAAIDFSNTANGGNAGAVNGVMDSNTMFPGTRMFEPENYEGSPLYKFQVKQGEDQLAKSLAAKGLTGSGTAIQQELDIPMMAAAQDTDRMTRVAESNADRYATIQQNEALRRERAGNSQWDRAYSLADLMSRQNPWDGALAGLNNYADVTGQAGQGRAAFIKDFYRRGGGGGGRGGGAGGGMPIVMPTGPDYSNIRPTEIGGNYSSNNGWMNLLVNGLSNLNWK